MTCRDFTAFIADFLAGELPSATRQQFEQHLTGCSNCARYLEHYRTTIALGQLAFDDQDAPVPADVPESLVDAILQARQTRATD